MSSHRERQLFVVNDFSGFAENFSEVQAGQLGFSKLGTVAATLTDGDENVQFALRNQASPIIHEGEVTRVIRENYSAGTPQSADADMTAAAPSGEPKYIKIIDTTRGAQPYDQRTFEGTAAEIAATINNITDGFLKDYTVTENAGVLSIAAPVDETFVLSGYDGISYANEVVGAPSIGIPAKVSVLERELLSYAGFTNQTKFPVRRPETQVEPDAEYDIVTVECITQKPNKAGTGALVAEKFSIMFALKKDTTTPFNSLAGDLVTEVNKLK